MNDYTHELKTDHEPFEAVLSGEKTHEVRSAADRDFKVGDTLVLRETRYSAEEMRRDQRPLEYTGRIVERVVTHIQRGYGLPFGVVVMSLAASASAEPKGYEAAMNFACFLIDRCEGETVSEEGIQRWLAAMIREPLYAPRPIEAPDNLQSVIADTAEPLPVYQIAFSDEDGWCDTYKAIYDKHPEHMRRTLYMRPIAPLPVESIADTAGAKPVSDEQEREQFDKWWATTNCEAVDMEWTDEKCWFAWKARAAIAAPPAPSSDTAGAIPEGRIIDAIKKACGEYRTNDSYSFEDVWNCIEAFIAAPPAPSVADATPAIEAPAQAVALSERELFEHWITTECNYDPVDMVTQPGGEVYVLAGVQEAWNAWMGSVEARAALSAPTSMSAEPMNCGTCGAAGTMTSTKARCTLCGMFAPSAENPAQDDVRIAALKKARHIVYMAESLDHAFARIDAAIASKSAKEPQ